MLGKKKQPHIKSLLGHDNRVEGHFNFTDGLRIDGEVIGNIRASAEKRSFLFISGSARVEGEICADQVIINGHVLGPVRANELLELQPKAHIEGDVYYKALEMHQGAVISGQLHPLHSDEEEKQVLKLASSNA